MKEQNRNGMKYFGNALKVTLGAGAALGGAYLFSRIKEKQTSETSISRVEQMLEELLAAGKDKKK
jgi:hypothetical protein